MAERTEIDRTLLWVVGLVLFAASAVAIYWITFAGGVRRAPPPAATAEECGASLAGSYLLTHALAADLVAAFLQAGGYAVGAPTRDPDGTMRVAGARAGLACTVSIRTMDSTQAFDELAAGRIAIALSQRFVHDRDAKRLAIAGAGDFEAERAKAETVLAFDAPAVIANAANPASEISVDDIRDIAVGRIAGWAELGGPEAAIALYLYRDGTSPMDFPNDTVTVRHPVFESLHQRATLLASDAAIIDAIARDPHGFGIVSSSFLANETRVRALAVRAGGPAHMPSLEGLRARTYPLMRRLFLYVRPANREDAFVTRFLAFATSEAARAVFERHGLIANPQAGAVATEAHGCLRGTAEAAAVAAATRGARRLDPPLRFEAESAALAADSLARVAALGAELRAELVGGATLVLIGHADVIGEAHSNRALAMRRAITAREAFEARGLFGAIVESAGEMCLARENVTETGRRTNQRVEVWLRPAAAATPAPQTP